MMDMNAFIVTIIYSPAVLTLKNFSGGIHTGFPESNKDTETVLWNSKDQSEEEMVAHDAAAQRW